MGWRRNARGFSLVELLTVCIIIIISLALLIPNMVQTIAAMKLRGYMGDLAGLYQNGRSIAIRQNRITELRHQVVGNQCVIYTDDLIDPVGLFPTTERKPAQLWLPEQIDCFVAPPSGGGGEPTAMDAAHLCAGSVSTPLTLNDDNGANLAFTQTGLPCQGTPCVSNYGFAYYFTYEAALGDKKWAALAVSPAGRIRACYWDGTAWKN